MLRNYLSLRAYKIRLVQELKLDRRKRRDFGEWAKTRFRWTQHSKVSFYTVMRLVFGLCKYAKSQVYTDSPQTLNDLAEAEAGMLWCGMEEGVRGRRLT